MKAHRRAHGPSFVVSPDWHKRYRTSTGTTSASASASASASSFSRVRRSTSRCTSNSSRVTRSSRVRPACSALRKFLVRSSRASPSDGGSSAPSFWLRSSRVRKSINMAGLSGFCIGAKSSPAATSALSEISDNRVGEVRDLCAGSPVALLLERAIGDPTALFPGGGGRPENGPRTRVPTTCRCRRDRTASRPCWDWLRASACRRLDSNLDTFSAADAWLTVACVGTRACAEIARLDQLGRRAQERRSLRQPIAFD